MHKLIGILLMLPVFGILDTFWAIACIDVWLRFFFFLFCSKQCLKLNAIDTAPLFAMAIFTNTAMDYSFEGNQSFTYISLSSKSFDFKNYSHELFSLSLSLSLIFICSVVLYILFFSDNFLALNLLIC